MPQPKYDIRSSKYITAYDKMNDVRSKLGLAVELGDMNAALHFLSLGADPFTETSDGQSSAFSKAIRRGKEFTTLFLDTAKKPFDLSKPHPLYSVEETERTMSWIQYACIFASDDVKDILRKYQAQKFPSRSFADLINECFYHKVDDDYKLTTLGYVMSVTMSPETIINNLCFNKDHNTEGRKFIKEWQYSTPFDTITTSLPEESILFVQSTTNFQYIFDHGYDTHAIDHNGRSLEAWLEILAAGALDVDKFNRDVLPYLILIRVTIHKATTLVNRKVVTDAQINNYLGVNPRNARIAFFIHAVQKVLRKHNERLQREKEAFPTAYVLAAKIDSHEHRLVRVESDIAKLSEVQYNQAYAALSAHPFHQQAFEKLYKLVKSLLSLRSDAHLKVFDSLPANKKWALPTNALVALHSLAECSNTGASALTALALAVIKTAESVDTAKVNKSVFDLSEKPEILATMISSLLINEAIKAHSTNPTSMTPDHFARFLFDKVSPRINKIGKTQFGEAKDIVIFLALDALSYLQAEQSHPVIAARKSKNYSIFSALCCKSTGNVFVESPALRVGSSSSLEHHSSNDSHSPSSTPVKRAAGSGSSSGSSTSLAIIAPPSPTW